MLLLPLVTGLVLIPLKQSVFITLLAIITYTLLILFPTPPPEGLSRADYVHLHLMGMWGTFALTATIMLVVVGSLAVRLREQQQALARSREDRLRDEQVIALGLSAASVAHRLGTPLNTMTLVVDDLKHERGAEPFREDLALLEQQLGVCRSQLHTMTEAAVQCREAAVETIPLEHWLRRLRESATLLWPHGNIRWPSTLPATSVQVDATLDQAVLNLLANALDALTEKGPPRKLWLSAETTAQGVNLYIRDNGPGFCMEALGRASEPFYTTKTRTQGLGLGLAICETLMRAFGGELLFANHKEGGALLTLKLRAGSPGVSLQPSEDRSV